MFFALQTKYQRDQYVALLKVVGALSKLSNNNSAIPYLYYRMSENAFCRAFLAKNLARSDISIDASKSDIGIGLKTFLHRNGHSLEKIAEFNKERILYQKFYSNTQKLIETIASLRNNRINATCGICSLSVDNLLYHCITRAEAIFYVHEEPMRLINVNNIKITTAKDNTINFNDGTDEYCFNISKSVLCKRFNILPIYSIEVKIFDDPFEFLLRRLQTEVQLDAQNKIVDTLYLPLYSYDKNTKSPIIPTRSGLNQWNAKGRVRSSNEVYIPYPAEVRHHKQYFFPPKDESFTLQFPDGTFKMAKICQQGDKALMTNPNEDLGKLILRDILKLDVGRLATYDKLIEVGIDTVQINKFEDGTYEINFKQLGTYEEYRRQELIQLKSQ